MRSFMNRSAMVVAAWLVCFSGSAGAATIDVKVPFPFVVSGKKMPAGEYRVEREGGSLLLIRGEKGIKADVYAQTVPTKAEDPAGSKPSLTFTRHETQYRLADVWDADGQGRQIVGS